MFELENFTKQVRRNCDISDARNAGLYSICGLALRLRDLFKWERRLPPWEEKESSQVLEWIGNKEEAWDKLFDSDYSPLSIDGHSFDPFDAAAVNTVLEPLGYFYGAGYAHGLKPTFFLAAVDDKKEIDGFGVYILGNELARDLLTLPALTQDNCVVFRQEAAGMYLWDKLLYMKKSGRPLLRFALDNCGLKDQSHQALRHHLAGILAMQTDTYIYHEIGEMRDTAFDRELWREIIGAYPHSPVELIARTLKDLLADTNEHGTLPHMIRERQLAALGLYAAFIDGLAREFFPELRDALYRFIGLRDWALIEDAVAAGRERARRYAAKVVEIHRAGKEKDDTDWAREEMVRCLLGDRCKGKTA
jgi:hypothetical protein